MPDRAGTAIGLNALVIAFLQMDGKFLQQTIDIQHSYDNMVQS